MTPESGPQANPFAELVISLAVAAAGILLFLSVGFASQALLTPGVGLWFTEAFIFLAVPYIVLRMAGRRPWVAAQVTKLNPRAAAFGFLVGVVNYFAAVIPLHDLSARVATGLWGKEWVEGFDSSGIFDDLTGWEMALILSAVTLAAPFCEEFFFRGVFQRGLMAMEARLGTVVLAGLVFAGFHLDPVGLLPRWEMGILFGLLAWKTGSIWPGVFAHLANNLTSSVVFLATKDISDDALPDWTAIAMLGVGYWLMWGLLKLAAAKPSLLQHPAPRLGVEQPPVPPWRAGWPWVAGATVVIAFCAAFDSRGIELNRYDWAHPMAAPRRSAADSEKEAWNRLMELRAKAREGQVPMDDYFDARKLAAGEWQAKNPRAE